MMQVRGNLVTEKGLKGACRSSEMENMVRGEEEEGEQGNTEKKHEGWVYIENKIQNL